MSAGADTKANTRESVRGRGVLELLDLRLFEDGGELGGALGSDLVRAETAKEGRSEDGQKSGVSRGADTKANTFGSRFKPHSALQARDLALRQHPGQLNRALRANNKPI